MEAISTIIPRRIFLLTSKQWLVAFVTGLAIAGASMPFYINISNWIGITLFLVGVVVVHMAYVGRFIMILPHIAILVSALQYVLAAWLNYYYPPTDPSSDIGPNLPHYLSYAGPTVIAYIVGWTLAITKIRPSRKHKQNRNRALSLELDLLLFVGLIMFFFSGRIQIESLNFIFLLFSNLRYIGVFGRMLMRESGWLWRLCLVLGLEALISANTAFFHDLLLWSAWSFAVWIYCYTPSPKVIIAMLVTAVLFLPALQGSKLKLRESVLDNESSSQYQGRSGDTPFVDRSIEFFADLFDGFTSIFTLHPDEEFIGNAAMRYNQGWIINRVMHVVPDYEPYARGSTLEESLMAALLPRFIMPAKIKAGGRDNVLRFAAIELNETTSMNLGYAGEMYANFGATGGIVGCGLYALFFGGVFRFLCKRAFSRPLWWAFVPFLLYPVFKAEDDIAFVLNWTVKASILSAGVLIILPELRRALFGPVARLVARQNSPSAGGKVRSL